MISLSAFELQNPRFLPPLLPQLDQLGYGCFWTSEHRSRFQSGSPVIVAAAALTMTRRIRVGTAGVKLAYYSPLKLAEDFHFLELLAPGRVDLGTISGVERDPTLHAALLDRRQENCRSYFDKFSELSGYLAAGVDEPPPTGVWTCRAPSRPRLWMCSMSLESAKLAAALSAGLAFSPHLTPQFTLHERIAVVDCYRSEYVASDSAPRPSVAVVCLGASGPTEPLARARWQQRYAGKPPEMIPPPAFLGASAQCRQQLEELAGQYQPTEIAIECAAADVDTKAESYAIVAESFPMSPRTGERVIAA